MLQFNLVQSQNAETAWMKDSEMAEEKMKGINMAMTVSLVTQIRII